MEGLEPKKVAEEVLPMFLKLAGKDVLVVGGGEVATRKVTELLGTGAKLRVVAKVASPALARLARERRISLELRPFRDRDLEGAWFVISATDSALVNRKVARSANSRRVFICAVDDPENASAYFGGIVRRPPFLVAISSGGEVPAVTRLVREVIESALPSEKFVEAARALRRNWKENGVPMSERFADLLAHLSPEGLERKVASKSAQPRRGK